MITTTVRITCDTCKKDIDKDVVRFEAVLAARIGTAPGTEDRGRPRRGHFCTKVCRRRWLIAYHNEERRGEGVWHVGLASKV